MFGIKNKFMPKKYVIKIILLALLFISLPLSSLAQDATISLQETIQLLQEQIKLLQSKIYELQKQSAIVRQETTEIRLGSKFTKNLSRGLRGEEVTKLQEFLRQHRDIYPEGLVTGYFFHPCDQFPER